MTAKNEYLQQVMTAQVKVENSLKREEFLFQQIDPQ